MFRKLLLTATAFLASTTAATTTGTQKTVVERGLAKGEKVKSFTFCREQPMLPTTAGSIPLYDCDDVSHSTPVGYASAICGPGPNIGPSSCTGHLVFGGMDSMYVTWFVDMALTPPIRGHKVLSTTGAFPKPSAFETASITNTPPNGYAVATEIFYKGKDYSPF